jgi:predicted nucleotidyltransferase component of viral defense system
MISRKELIAKASENKIPTTTIDKDYVLGHFLNILFQKEWALSNFVFKGGTCLKKCYFENYRYSEDIDLTILDPNFILQSDWLKSLCQEVSDVADIPLNILKNIDVIHNDKHVGFDIEICYWGVDHNKGESPVFRKVCHTKIILEIRHFELIALPLVHRKLIHPYSDSKMVYSTIPCYSIEEILSEKLRALIQRNRGEARDYFDLWYIKNNVSNIDWVMVKEVFFKKCAFKDIEFTSFNQFFLEERIRQVHITWDKRLKHQLPFQIEKEIVISELYDFLNTLF